MIDIRDIVVRVNKVILYLVTTGSLELLANVIETSQRGMCRGRQSSTC